MRAVVITQPGGVDVLEVADRPARDPGEGEVRIAVKAAAVNPTDIGLRQLGGGDQLPSPWVPGMDAAGVVESVGPGVERAARGDEVMAVVSPRRPEGGAEQELLVVPAASVVPIPDGASMPEAATLPMNGLTALRGLDMLGLESGETLAVAGGAGLLGSYVISLAKERGLRVIADAKPEDEELVRSFGADVVVPRSDSFSNGDSPGWRPTASTRCTTPRCSTARRSERCGTAARSCSYAGGTATRWRIAGSACTR